LLSSLIILIKVPMQIFIEKKVDKLVFRAYSSICKLNNCRGNQMSNFNQAVTAVHSMTSSEIDLMVEAIKLRRTALARGSVRKLSVGDLVKFTGKRGETVRGSVVKLNRKTAIVNSQGQQWRVTASLLSTC
jgi:hypothetical protein